MTILVPVYDSSLCSIGHLTTKSDVYSFGVVLLEILSGKKAIDKNRPTGEHSLVEWAKPYLTNKRRIFRVMDTRIEGQYPVDLASKAATLALQCISMDPRPRPNMDQVVTVLQELLDSKEASRAEKKEKEREYAINRRSQSNGGSKLCKSSAGDRGTRSIPAYPRPALYA